MDPKVSVILPTFNGASRGYLDEAIESALSQTYKNYELIIIDDGSNDGTEKVCKKYLDGVRVKYIYQDNKGLAIARNTGIVHSSGSFVCFIDDDDVWKREKLQRQIDFFIKNNDPRVGMVYTAAEYIDEEGRSLGIRYAPAKGDIYKTLIFKGNIITCPSSVMIKKEVLEKVGILKAEMKSLEDLELWFRIAQIYHVYSINDDLVKYRLHQNRITSSHYKREEFYELLLYYTLLQNEKGINEDIIYRNIYQRFAIRHFSLGNYREVRKFYKIASAYATPELSYHFMFLLSYFPSLAKMIKNIRRKVKKSFFIKKRKNYRTR